MTTPIGLNMFGSKYLKSKYKILLLEREVQFLKIRLVDKEITLEKLRCGSCSNKKEITSFKDWEVYVLSIVASISFLGILGVAYYKDVSDVMSGIIVTSLGLMLTIFLLGANQAGSNKQLRFFFYLSFVAYFILAIYEHKLYFLGR